MNWDFWKDRNAMSRLTQSIRFYRQELSWSRKQRTQNIQDYVGYNYMQGGSKHKRPINMVFQAYALFPHLTVAENIFLEEYPKRADGSIDWRAIRAEAKQAA